MPRSGKPGTQTASVVFAAGSDEFRLLQSRDGVDVTREKGSSKEQCAQRRHIEHKYFCSFQNDKQRITPTQILSSAVLPEVTQPRNAFSGRTPMDSFALRKASRLPAFRPSIGFVNHVPAYVCRETSDVFKASHAIHLQGSADMGYWLLLRLELSVAALNEKLAPRYTQFWIFVELLKQAKHVIFFKQQVRVKPGQIIVITKIQALQRVLHDSFPAGT